MAINHYARNNLTLPIIAVFFVLFVGLIYVGHAKAAASVSYQAGGAPGSNGYYCGVNVNSLGSEAGLIVQEQWSHYGTNEVTPVADGSHTDVLVNTIAGIANNPTSMYGPYSYGDPGTTLTSAGNLVQLSSTNGNNSGSVGQYEAGGRALSLQFNLVDANCYNMGYVADLGQGGPTSTPTYGPTGPLATSMGNYWALDCDYSVRSSASPPWQLFQTFSVTGEGTPAGARAGGTWDTAIVQPPNGETAVVYLHYYEPPPPNPPPPPEVTVSGSIGVTTNPGVSYSKETNILKIGLWDNTLSTWQYTYIDTTANPTDNYSFQVPEYDSFAIRIITGAPSYYGNPLTNYQAWTGSNSTEYYLCTNNSYEEQTARTVADGGSYGPTSCGKPGYPSQVSPTNNKYNFIYVLNSACTLTPSSNKPDPGQSFTLSATYKVNGAAVPSGTVVTYAFSASPSGITGLGSSTTGTLSGLSGSAGNYTLTVNESASGLPSASCSTNVSISDKPYLKVYGGDVMAGSGFDQDCSGNTSAGIISWNSDSPGYKGAGTEFGAVAYGQITGFASDQAGPGSGTGLSFANTQLPSGITANPTNDQFGGGYGSSCATNFYGSGNSGPAITGDSSLPSSDWSGGTYHDGDNNTPVSTTLDLSGTVPAGSHVAIYVNGSVFITSNIEFGGDSGSGQTASWNSVGDIPSFELFVKGNIYIAPGVSELDGLYVAQEGSNTTTNPGIIYDCANSIPPNSSEPGFYSTCNHQLTVNGAFVANQVDFMRTYGTLSDSDNKQQCGNGSGSESSTAGETSCAAEQFNYTPALWLGLMSANTNLQSTNYDSITSLSPIL